MTWQLKRMAAILQPLDVLFFRDARPFGASLRGSSGPPLPQTLVGAVRTALADAKGCDIEVIQRVFTSTVQQSATVRERQETWRKVAQERGVPPWFFGIQFRGPWFIRAKNKDAFYRYKLDPSEWELLFHTPATLYSFRKIKGEADTLWLAKPLPQHMKLPGWRPPREGMRPLWVPTREDVEPCGGFITATGMQKLLQGQVPGRDDLVGNHEVYDFDERTGIGIDADRLTSDEGKIYAARFLALKQYVAFYLEVTLPAEEEATWKSLSFLRWGGEGKHVAVKHLEAPIELPCAMPTDGAKPLLVLTTPGLFKAGWYPACLQDRLVAAAVPGEVAISGWDLTRGGPKPTRFAAAAGSVYFLDQLPEKLEKRLEDHKPLSDKPQDRQRGWGCCLLGVWNDG